MKSGVSQKSDLHYSVKGSGGKKEIYSKPSLRIKPPELPPRNTPTNSKLFDEPVSPDYMDVEVTLKSQDCIIEINLLWNRKKLKI